MSLWPLPQSRLSEPRKISLEGISCWVGENFGYSIQSVSGIDMFAGLVRPTWLYGEPIEDLTGTQKYELKTWELIDRSKETGEISQEIKERVNMLWLNYWSAKERKR